MSADLTFILGTRPEIIKLAPVIRECVNRDVQFQIIHTGQHYSENLSRSFFEELDIQLPDYNLQVGSESQGVQTGTMMIEIEHVLEDLQPTTVLIQGDTNSVLAGALVASKLSSIEIGHVEAGLRSFNRNMSEEINRKVTDHISEHLFAPTVTARENLISEGLSDERISVTGNTIVDSVKQNIQIAQRKSNIINELDLKSSFALLTVHREENVDNRKRFSNILEGVASASKNHKLSVVYPIHPRAKKRVFEFGLEIPDPIQIVDPLDFLDFLILENQADVVFTDSGGVQEETCILQTPCVTLRDETERPETVTVGANHIVGDKYDKINAAVTTMLSKSTDWENPFGDGKAAEKIINVLI